MIEYLYCSFAGSYWIPCKLLQYYEEDETYKIKYTDPITGQKVKEVVPKSYLHIPGFQW